MTGLKRALVETAMAYVRENGLDYGEVDAAFSAAWGEMEDYFTPPEEPDGMELAKAKRERDT